MRAVYFDDGKVALREIDELSDEGKRCTFAQSASAAQTCTCLK